MAKTINDIQTLDDLRGTRWNLKENLPTLDFPYEVNIYFKDSLGNNINCLRYFAYDECYYNYHIQFKNKSLYLNSSTIIQNNNYYGIFGYAPRRLNFDDWHSYTIGGINASEELFINYLKQIGDLVPEGSIEIISDLSNTKWSLNDTFKYTQKNYIVQLKTRQTEIIEYATITTVNNGVSTTKSITKGNDSSVIIDVQTRNSMVGLDAYITENNNTEYYIIYLSYSLLGGGYQDSFIGESHILEFKDLSNVYESIDTEETDTSGIGFITWLKENAELIPEESIKTIDDLKGTMWILKEDLTTWNNEEDIVLAFTKKNNLSPFTYRSENSLITNQIQFAFETSYAGLADNTIAFTDKLLGGTTKRIVKNGVYQGTYGTLPRKLTFNDWENYTLILGNEEKFLNELREIADLVVEEPEEPTGTIVRVNGKILNKVNGKKVRAIHYGDKTWEL